MTARPTIDQLLIAADWLQEYNTTGSREEEDAVLTAGCHTVAKWLHGEAIRRARLKGTAEVIAATAKKWGVSMAEVRKRLAEHKRKMKRATAPQGKE